MGSSTFTRQNKKCIRCNGSIIGGCIGCLDTGFRYVDKLVKGYSYLAVHGRDFLTEIGKVNTDTPIYILESDTSPKEGDFIAELDLEEETGVPRQPFTIIRFFKVQDAKEYRGRDGIIEFFKLYTKEHNFDRGSSITKADIN